MKDINGNVVGSLNAGQQAQVFVTIQNNEAFSQSFTGIIDLRDAVGVSLNLQWQTGVLQANGEQEIEVSWAANFDTTQVTAHAFVISDFEEPIILSSVATSSFKIETIGQS